MPSSPLALPNADKKCREGGGAQPVSTTVKNSAGVAPGSPSTRGAPHVSAPRSASGTAETQAALSLEPSSPAIPATKPGAGEGGEVQNDTSTNDRTWLLSDVGRMRIEVEEFSRLFPHSRPIFEEHAEANGPTVPLIGVIERLLGIVRRATPG